MTLQPHDFRKPPPLPAALRASLANWANQVCAQACRLWGSQLPFEITLEPCGIEVLPASQLFERIPDTALRFRTPLNANSELSLLVTSRPLLVAILGGLLGSPPDAADLDIELTPVEEEMAEFVAEHFFLAPLQQAWPLAEKLSLTAPRRESLSAEPAYLPSAMLVVVQFRAKGEFGEFDWWWMLPRNGWLASLTGNSAATTPARETREAAIRDLPVRMTVQLGSVRLSLLHLAALQVGDLLILDQPINQALPALLGGQKKFLVWPGACGARQAISVHAPLES